MSILETLLTALYNKIIDFIEYIFDLIFGSWNYGVLFSWLPNDIQAAVEFIILFLFGIALVKLIKELIPI